MGTADFVEEYDRTYKLHRPPEHKVPIPRYVLKLPSSVTHVYTLYLGVQSRSPDSKSLSRAHDFIQDFLNNGEGKPIATDVLKVSQGFDLVDSKIWVSYWTDAQAFESKLQSLDLKKAWNQLEDKASIGLWSERFTTPRGRLETTYSGLLHKPGVAQLPGEFLSHDLTGYWGSGRDRLPAAKDDLFPPSEGTGPPERAPAGIGEYLTGSNYDNMCHIRSGQWWAQCSREEADAYEDNLQDALKGGMAYLCDHPEEFGTLGLRFLQNIDDNDQPVKETCGAGFFRNWAHLETWSSRHPSHLAIFVGALEHGKRFGPEKKFMTWHEVSILKEGEARFEYVNCSPETGVIKWVAMKREAL